MNLFKTETRTKDAKLPDREFDSQHRRIWPVQSRVHNPESIKASLEVSIETLEELAADYKVPHYVAIDFHDTIGGNREPTGLLVHFAYLPDGSMVLAYTKDSGNPKT